MAIARKIVDWCDEKMDESMHDEDPKSFVKAGVSGFVEGAVDGAILMYVPLMIACYCWKKKAAKE